MDEKNLNTIPTIKIAGKSITPKNPKMKVWRKFLEFFDKSDEELKAMSLSEYTSAMIELIRLGFNREEITLESIEENLSVGELRPLVLDLFSWLQMVFFKGVAEIPKNEETAEDN